MRQVISFIASALWRWDVTGIGSTLLYGFGVGAMYGDDYIVAGMLYFTGTAWLAARILAWEETRTHPQRGLVSAGILIVTTLALGSSGLWIRHRSIMHAAEKKEASLKVKSEPETVAKNEPKVEESGKEPPKIENPPVVAKKKPPTKTIGKSEPPATLEQTVHPVIGVAASSVTRDASSRQVKIIITLQNISSFETTAHIGTTATWNGAVIYPITEPRDYAFLAQAWVEVTHPIYLSQQDEAAFLDGTGSLRIYLNAEYPDRGGKTVFVLEGRVDPKLPTIDVTKSAWSH